MKSSNGTSLAVNDLVVLTKDGLPAIGVVTGVKVATPKTDTEAACPETITVNAVVLGQPITLCPEDCLHLAEYGSPKPAPKPTAKAKK